MSSERTTARTSESGRTVGTSPSGKTTITWSEPKSSPKKKSNADLSSRKSSSNALGKAVGGRSKPSDASERKKSSRATISSFVTTDRKPSVSRTTRQSPGQTFKRKLSEGSKILSKAENVHERKGSTADSKHTIRDDEKIAFSEWMNAVLAEDKFLVDRKIIPVDPAADELFDKCRDGILVCKLINTSVPGTVDERALNHGKLNKFTTIENLNLMVNSAGAIGCHVVNVGAVEIYEGKEHLILGLLWQIIRIGLLSNVNLEFNPGLAKVLLPSEDIDSLRRLAPEDILLRWVNHHLARSTCKRRMTNFMSDIVDGEIYTHLLHQIAPKTAGVTLEPLKELKHIDRARHLLEEADKINCRQFVRPYDIANGNYKLNLAFVANLFNMYPKLEDEKLSDTLKTEVDDTTSEIDPTHKPQPPTKRRPPPVKIIQESREERTYRNWMNSLGVTPRVNYLYSDINNGLIIFQLFDLINPNFVDWKKVKKKFDHKTGYLDQINNGQYAIELGLQMGFSLVGIEGKDLYDESKTHTLALVWQLMRAYNLKVLKDCGVTVGLDMKDTEIVGWVNTKLEKGKKKSRIKNFGDKSIASSLPVLELVDAIQPGIVDWKQYIELTPKSGFKERMANARYAISVARKLGAKVYALPEDIAEVVPKMVLTMFVSLLARDLRPDLKAQTGNKTGLCDT